MPSLTCGAYVALCCAHAYVLRMNIDKTIQTIVRTLGIGRDQIPMRRALRMCLTQLDELRDRGLTWGQIAMRLTKAGARHKRGQAISEHQLRTEYGRLVELRDAGSKPKAVASSSAGSGNSQKFLLRGDKEPSASLLRKSMNEQLDRLTATRKPRLELDD